MKVSALASGSSGNCFYIENDKSSVLIDAGISSKRILERLSHIKRSPSNINGIFITHEHIDHIRGADVFARKFKIPIFATANTIKNSFLCSDESLLHKIKNNETVKIKNLNVKAFPKSHSASDPVSYTVTENKNVSIMTDLGYLCKESISNISISDFIFLESNHDIRMLENGPYPEHLKKWIKSNEGHLSNKQAALGILEHAKDKLKQVILSHLSETNNTPQKALSTFNVLLKERKNFQPKIFVSLRDAATPLFNI
ncbi:MBL fold metallo-hydrolase [Candidatus Pacearchaeota archaeon]|nr:MBL fold metallo-hydrolase [Candidatus Pacearchaeota archaeon]